MPDISMCIGNDCTKKEKCYRFKAKPCEYAQSYFCDPPFEIKDGVLECGYFWPIEKLKKEV